MHRSHWRFWLGARFQWCTDSGWSSFGGLQCSAAGWPIHSGMHWTRRFYAHGLLNRRSIHDVLFTFVLEQYHVDHGNWLQLSKCQHMVQEYGQAHSLRQSRCKKSFSVRKVDMIYLRYLGSRQRLLLHAHIVHQCQIWSGFYMDNKSLKWMHDKFYKLRKDYPIMNRRMTSSLMEIRHIQFGLVTSPLDQPSRATSDPLRITCKPAASWRFSHPLHRMQHRSCCGRYAKTLVLIFTDCDALA